MALSNEKGEETSQELVSITLNIEFLPRGNMLSKELIDKKPSGKGKKLENCLLYATNIENKRIVIENQKPKYNLQK